MELVQAIEQMTQYVAVGAAAAVGVVLTVTLGMIYYQGVRQTSRYQSPWKL